MKKSVKLAILLIISKISEDSESSIPKWLNYKRDTFNGVQYRWEWVKNFEGKYDIQNLSVHCINCDCLLIGPKCPNCQSKYFGKIKSENELKALIYHRSEKMSD